MIILLNVISKSLSNYDNAVLKSDERKLLLNNGKPLRYLSFILNGEVTHQSFLLCDLVKSKKFNFWGDKKSH